MQQPDNDLSEGLRLLSGAVGTIGGRMDDEASTMAAARRLLDAGAQIASHFDLDAAALEQWLARNVGAITAGPAPIPAPALATWLVRGKKELGTLEAPGVLKNNPRILEYQEATVQRETGDHIPWCSAYICWLMEQEGIVSPRDARARSWLNWGQEMNEPRMGCVVVFWRGRFDDGFKGHVGLWVGEDKTRIRLHGGNQSNRVSEVWYPKSRVLSYRWPSKDVG